MKKLFTIALIALSIGASAQKKDSTAKVDTVYQLSLKDMQLITTLIRSNPVQLQGKALSFDEVLQLIQYLESKQAILPKKQN